MCGDRAAIMPVDPVSGGTWIGANDAGVVMTLLNVHRTGHGDSTEDRDREFRSRGEIIPALMSEPTPAGALDAALRIDPLAYPAFRAVLLGAGRVSELLSDGRSVEVRSPRVIDRPIMFTSSGLGDELVDPPRRELFDAIFAKCRDWRGNQDLFHLHSWPDRPHLSVQMSRAEARTVSRTWVEITDEVIDMTYLPIGENPSAASSTLRLALGKEAAWR